MRTSPRGRLNVMIGCVHIVPMQGMSVFNVCPWKNAWLTGATRALAKSGGESSNCDVRNEGRRSVARRAASDVVRHFDTALDPIGSAIITDGPCETRK